MSAQERLQKLAELTGLGTVTALADAAGIKPGTAQKHKDRDSIPAKKVPNYVAAAARHGVTVGFEWLHSGRGPVPTKLVSADFVPRSVPKLPPDPDSTSADKDGALRLPLWQISVTTRGEEGVPVLMESRDKVPATEKLRDVTGAFAVRVWDASNGPYLPRGTLLFVERPYGGSLGELCIFAEHHTETELIRPVLGILQGETDDTWTILRHITATDLPKADFPVCWRIKHIDRD